MEESDEKLCTRVFTVFFVCWLQITKETDKQNEYLNIHGPAPKETDIFPPLKLSESMRSSLSCCVTLNDFHVLSYLKYSVITMQPNIPIFIINFISTIESDPRDIVRNSHELPPLQQTILLLMNLIYSGFMSLFMLSSYQIRLV